MPQYQHLIIVGANKCGTTSLFRYLSDHPLVCGSARKEAHFFDREENYISTSPKDAYLAHFPARTSNHRVLLEATPNYLDRGQTLARRIQSVLGDPFLIVMLRNPIDRLVSYYKSKQGWVDSPVHNMSFSAFTDQALASRVRDSTKLGRSEAEFSLQVRKSEYCGPLDQFYSIFSADKILVVFLDSLRTNPSDCLRSVCDFVDLPSGFFEQYDFRVENQSRYHRSPLLRTMSSKANLVLEPLLNRLPWSRNALRRVYNFANVTTSKSHRIDKDSITKLEDHFAPYNRELRTLLEKQNVTTDLPSWLNH